MKQQDNETTKENREITVEETILEKSQVGNITLLNVFNNKEKFFDTESKKYIYLKDYFSDNYMFNYGKDGKKI